MATSNSDPRALAGNRRKNRLSRYDLLLLVIPAAFLIALGVSQLLSLSVSTAMGAASAIGALAVADGLFVNPPHQD